MKVQLIREKRRTIVLRLIDEHNAVLKVPPNFSDAKVKEFLESKKRWLSVKAAAIRKNKEFSGGFEFESCFYLFGEKVDMLKNLILGFDELSGKQKSIQIKNLYLSHFSNLEMIASDLSKETGIVFRNIKPTSSKRIWGSFNSSKEMKLNWKLVILPKDLVEYVVYHELCHSKHMNHKPQFWNSVSKFCPDYKQKKKALEAYGFLLRNEI